MNCTGCQNLDQNSKQPPGNGYCCMVERSSQKDSFRYSVYGEKISPKVRTPEMERCELYSAGDFRNRHR